MTSSTSKPQQRKKIFTSVNYKTPKMADTRVWKVVYFPADQTFSVLKGKDNEARVNILDETKALVKFGQVWFEGRILESTETKKEATQLLKEHERRFSIQSDEVHQTQGKKNSIIYLSKQLAHQS